MTDLTVLTDQLTALHASAVATSTDSAAQTKLAWVTRVLGDVTTGVSEALTLSKQLFLSLERPPALKAKGKEWQAEFTRLLKDYTYTDLSGCIHWIFAVDDFWVRKVMAAPDPLVYITGKMDALMQRFRGWRKAERNRAAQAEKASPTCHWGNVDQEAQSRDTRARRLAWEAHNTPTIWGDAPDPTEVEGE